MFIKWIICNVEDHKKQEFSVAQEKWSETVNSKGFIAQVGGWDLKNKNEACIISLWENKKSLDNFMTNTHDTIFNRNKQDKTYSSIEIKYFNSLNLISDNYKFLKEGIKDAKYLRIETLKASKDEIENFKKSEMNHSTSILGKEFTKSTTNEVEYLISTFCYNFENNNSHLNHSFTQILERQILLVDSWRIIAS